MKVFLLLLCFVSTTSQVDLQVSKQDINAVLREMTASLAQLKERVSYLQKENRVNTEKLENQQSNINLLETNLKAKLEKQEVVVKRQQTDINVLKTNLKVKLKKQEVVVKRQQSDIDVLKTNLKVRQVAFSASLLAKGEATIGVFNEHTTLIFKHVVTNIGGAYNPNTGIFTAPVRGAYHFEWYIGVHGAATAAVLVKNSNHIFIAYEYQSKHFGSSSQGVSLLLEAGDVVFVRLWTHTKTFDNQNHHTTFSGHLIFPM